MTPYDQHNLIFQKAVAFVNQTNRHLFITGKAGTGKTTFLKYIKEHSLKKMAIVAPTGVAAINAGGVTIHSFFQLPFGAYIPVIKNAWGIDSKVSNPSSLISGLRLNADKQELIRELEMLVIDEVSMVRADLLDSIDCVLRHFRKQSHLPFGGVQMIFIGDLFQLPPVTKNEEWGILKEYYKSPFFFEATALTGNPPLYIELKKMYRQKDDLFINILNNVRNNTCTEQDLHILHQNYKPGFSPSKEENFITLTSHNDKADRINQMELEKLPGKAYSFDAKITGDFSERAFPAEKTLVLKKDAQVMFLKNDKGEARKFFNGKIGTIVEINTDKIKIRFPDESELLELQKETWQNIRYNYNKEEDVVEEEEQGSFVQYPIRLAWAITIHKSQGLTFEKAIIDAGASFAAGQVYVSLSRLTSLEGLVLYSRILPQCITTDKRVIQFVENEIGEDKLNEILVIEQKKFVNDSLVKAFAWEKLSDLVTTHADSYTSRQIDEKIKSHQWAEGIRDIVNELLTVTVNFRKQLAGLLLTCEEDGFRQLNLRTVAAAGYLEKMIEEKLLSSLDAHINHVKTLKKNKTYILSLLDLKLHFERQKQQLLQAIQIASAMQKSQNLDNLLEMVETGLKPIPVVLPEIRSVAKYEKGETQRLSLQLFKKGKSITDISAERNLAAGTIAGHLAGFILTGEVDVMDLVSQDKLELILKVIEEDKDITLGGIRQKLGEDFTFGEINAAVNYSRINNNMPVIKA